MNGYVIAGWITTFGALAAYTAKVLLRERVLRNVSTEIDLRNSQEFNA